MKIKNQQMKIQMNEGNVSVVSSHEEDKVKVVKSRRA